ncbi:MAG TPA: hypothetical protein DDZ81_06110 [Acetobacteraceae bacterium]|jgi:uncharacterized protein|nr:hypothetical protein [Acetobacteraceae bacterium]
MYSGNYIRIHLLSMFGVASAQFALADRLASRDVHTRACTLFAKAAMTGLPRAQYRLGRCYLMGLGLPPSINEAVRWFHRAARAGDPHACLQLAELALQGVDDTIEAGLFGGGTAEPDLARAAHWCRRAVAAGSTEAKALLGFILTNGPDRNEAVAESLYRDAAAAGSARGQLGLALILLRGGSRAGARQARFLLRRAAASGIAAAHHILGMVAESESDFVAAIDHYRQAADSGHTQAQVRYGFALLEGRGTAADAFTAETWLRKAAVAGDTQAAAVLGFLYARGDSLPRIPTEAIAWLERAARAGHHGAAQALSTLGQACVPTLAQSNG